MMRTLLHLLMIFAGIAVMVWLLPPREIERRLAPSGAQEGGWRPKEAKLTEPPPAPPRFTFAPEPVKAQRYTVCAFAGRCWEAPWGANPVPIGGTKY